MDRWCEQRMWREANFETEGAELVSCGTAIALIAVPLVVRPSHFTSNLRIVQFLLVLLAVGTFVYHWIPHDENWVNAFDWIPMILVVAQISYMMAIRHLDGYWYSIIFGALLVAWGVGLTAAMNMTSYVYLNIALVVPPVLVLMAYMDPREGAEVWMWLVVSLILWLVNHFACWTWAPLAVLHALYHITMALALWTAAIVAECEKL
jgi:hypothetical protein